MNRIMTRGAVATLALGLALTACRTKSNEDRASLDSTTTRSQGGSTGARARRGETARGNDNTEKGSAGKGGIFARHVFMLPAGTAISATNENTISSRTSRVGSRVTARVEEAIYSGSGDTVIPAGAEFIGHVTEIHTAPRPGATGTLQLKFDSVHVGSEILPVGVKIDQVNTTSRGRGVTTTDAAKVGAGAVIGGVAGRILGHNAKGTIIGAATGAAAGAVIAHNTRTVDIVLPAGSQVRMELTQPFDRTGRAVATNP